MARRSGFWASMAQASREAERQRQAMVRAQQRDIRAREQARRAMERARAANEREEKRLHIEEMEADAEDMRSDLQGTIEDLEGILRATLPVDDYIDLDGLKRPLSIPPFNPGALGQPVPPPNERAYDVPALTFAQKLVPGSGDRHQKAIAEARQRLDRDRVTWQGLEADRTTKLAALRAQYDREVERLRQETATQHAEIDAMKADLDRGDPETIRSYFEMVLGGSSWPDGFPQRFALAFDPSSKLLAIEYQLPDFSVVPAEKGFRYVKASDRIEPIAETLAHRKALYAKAIAQSAIRILHEVFEADRRSQIDSVVLNCKVESTDLATGQKVSPCVVSVRTTAQAFRGIKLDAVDPIACLKGLAAAVSPSPADLAPVRPVLELKMVDPRFVAEADVMSTLDQRPNLMELTPAEFESLITNLFTKMGLESRQTQASRDGGVDCVAFDPRPIFGGKVVIQAKRYKNTVGVSAVRDLYGTMQNEGASKGILVTTSGYGSAAFDFAKGKPLELLTGANLLYLLAENAGIEARIVVPDQWKDPVADSDFEASPTR